MTNPQTGPYPVLFARNVSSAQVRSQIKIGSSHFSFSVGPGEIGSVPWVIAKSAGFHRLWESGDLEVSNSYDFETTLNELPSIGADGGPTNWEEIEGTPETFPPAEHTRSWDEIDGKPTVFPPETHVHTIANVKNLQTALNGKAASDHTHTTAQVTGLQDALDAKVDDSDARLSDARTPTSHTHTWAEIDGKPTTFPPEIGNTATTAVAGNDPRLSDSRTPKDHSHAWADITGKPTIPDAAPVAAAQADSTAEDIAGLVADFNSLLGKLRAAGIVAS